MHRGHDHDHSHATPGPGHNGAAPKSTAQWQTPHMSPDHPHEEVAPAEADIDLVEAAFVEGFLVASDPTSFVRLARVPFEALAPDGARLVLLRVEVDALTDVGSVTPHLGGGSFRYDPLPGKVVSRRRRLRFIYFDGSAARALPLGEVRALREG